MALGTFKVRDYHRVISYLVLGALRTGDADRFMSRALSCVYIYLALGPFRTRDMLYLAIGAFGTSNIS